MFKKFFLGTLGVIAGIFVVMVLLLIVKPFVPMPGESKKLASMQNLDCSVDTFYKIRPSYHSGFKPFIVEDIKEGETLPWAAKGLKTDPNAKWRCEISSMDNEGTTLTYYIEQRADGSYQAAYRSINMQKALIKSKDAFLKGVLFE